MLHASQNTKAWFAVLRLCRAAHKHIAQVPSGCAAWVKHGEGADLLSKQCSIAVSSCQQGLAISPGLVSKGPHMLQLHVFAPVHEF